MSNIVLGLLGLVAVWAMYVYYRYEIRSYKKGELVAVKNKDCKYFRVLGEIVNVDQEKRVYKVCWPDTLEYTYHQHNEIRRVFDNSFLNPPI